VGDLELTRELDAARVTVEKLRVALAAERERGLELAFRDPLTGLPNRALLEEHLTLALARARRAATAVVLLYIDLDAFRLVNESLGHVAGNRVLAAVAGRLSEAVRSTDLLARPAGDEYLLLMADIDPEDAVSLAEQAAARIIEVMRAPFSVDGSEFALECSIGIALCTDGAASTQDLLEQADAAAFRAKQVARGSWTVFERPQAPEGRDRLEGSTRLRKALANEEFLLHYQPIFDVARGQLTGVEALLRWNDPERGMVPPGDFIPLAEETGLIESIGDWVVGAVCEQQVKWTKRGLDVTISFNVSPRQLRRLDFADRVKAHLDRTGANPDKLTAELTESATMEDPAESETILRALHTLGLGLALDDFGSGYSSLSRLKEMPVKTVKIDRAFLREVPDSDEASAFVSAILKLSKALGRITVAEGVETEAQHRFLAQQGCPLAQGFLLARPLPPSGVEDLLLASQPA
jgi:diguanylate cyclase (GGDEF)-like protein